MSDEQKCPGFCRPGDGHCVSGYCEGLAGELTAFTTKSRWKRSDYSMVVTPPDSPSPEARPRSADLLPGTVLRNSRDGYEVTLFAHTNRIRGTRGWYTTAKRSAYLFDSEIDRSDSEWSIVSTPVSTPPVVEGEQRCSHGRTVSQDCRQCAYDELLPYPAPVTEGPWRVDLICCGHEDGHVVRPTWAEAEQFRQDYTSGAPTVDPQGYSGHGWGHKRAGILRRDTTHGERTFCNGYVTREEVCHV